jgi:hypothetical protein
VVSHVGGQATVLPSALAWENDKAPVGEAVVVGVPEPGGAVVGDETTFFPDEPPDVATTMATTAITATSTAMGP